MKAENKIVFWRPWQDTGHYQRMQIMTFFKKISSMAMYYKVTLIVFLNKDIS